MDDHNQDPPIMVSCLELNQAISITKLVFIPEVFAITAIREFYIIVVRFKVFMVIITEFVVLLKEFIIKAIKLKATIFAINFLY